jgi:hypothetical protein
MESPRFLSFKDLKRYGIAYCDMQLRRKESDGSFPHRVKIGKNRCAWLSNEIEAWIAALAAAPRGRKQVSKRSHRPRSAQPGMGA